MTNEQIIKKSIEKVIENGYVHTQRSFDFLASIDHGILNDYYIREDLYYPIIFSHSFAKAFWGENLIAINVPSNLEDIDGYEDAIAWQYHLQQMILEREPLRYLERFL